MKIKVKTMSEWQQEGKEPEILFWVGSAGSFDERAKKITKAVLSPLKKIKASDKNKVMALLHKNFNFADFEDFDVISHTFFELDFCIVFAWFFNEFPDIRYPKNCVFTVVLQHILRFC